MTFNFQGKYLFLTYPTHIEEKDLEEIIDRQFEKNKPRWDAVHESSDKKNPYDHTHVQLFFEKKAHIRNCRKLDIGNNHCHIEVIYTKEHWTNLTPYIRKQNEPFHKTLTGNEYQFMSSLRDKIQEYKSWKDVVNSPIGEMPFFAAHLQWAKEVFACRQQEFDFNLEKEYGSFLKWQENALKKLENQTKREILWIFDPDGNNGKSELSDHIEDNHNAFIIEGGKFADIAYMWNLEKTVVFDLMRSQEDFVPYKAMEALKKGRMNSTKYTPQRKKIKGGCKIIVFANHLPDESKMSLDRWDVCQIIDGELVTMKEKTEKSSEIPRPSARNLESPKNEKKYVVPRCLNIKRAPCVDEDQYLENLLRELPKLDKT